MKTQPIYSYQDGRLNLWTNLDGHYLATDDLRNLGAQEINALGRIDSITIPFFYWAASRRDHLPEYANVFRYGTYPLMKSNKGSPPDIIGRLEIQINRQDVAKNNMETVRFALQRTRRAFAQREGYHSLLFQTFIPFSTRTLKDTCKSLFPFTGVGREHLASKGFQDKIVPSLIIGLIMLIADLATIAFRLVALIPRLIYQHCLQKNIPIEYVQQRPNFEWGKGTVMIHSTGDNWRDDDKIVKSYPTPAFYLG